MDWRWIKALDKRLMYYKWAKERARKELYKGWVSLNALDMYESCLEIGPTYYMDPFFCDLVEHARETIPDHTEWEFDWLQSLFGWMWIDKPVYIPDIELDGSDADNRLGQRWVDQMTGKIAFSAIGWYPVPEGTQTRTITGVDKGIVGKNCTEFCVFQDFSVFNKNYQEAFGLWSYFLLSPGDKLMKRMEDFENLSNSKPWIEAKYKPGRASELHHEIRWVYTAFHLMAQKLAVTTQHDHDRSTKKRFAQHAPQWPSFLRVVSLRRREQHKKEAGKAGEAIDWQWQWTVRGHWRDQWYPSKGTHQPVFIESYIKGPEDKPLKPPTHTIFNAER